MDISRLRGESLNAVGLWKTARLLFEQSYQAGKIDIADARLDSMPQDVLSQHSEQSARVSTEDVPASDPVGETAATQEMDMLVLDGATGVASDAV